MDGVGWKALLGPAVWQPTLPRQRPALEGQCMDGAGRHCWGRLRGNERFLASILRSKIKVIVKLNKTHDQ